MMPSYETRRFFRHMITALSCTVVFPLLSACSIDVDDCSTHTPCQVGFFCDNGSCYPLNNPTGTVTISLRVNPSARDPNFSPQRIADLTVELGDTLPDLALLPFSTISGNLRDQAFMPLDAIIHFQQLDCITGLCEHFTSQTNPYLIGQFSFHIAPGHYDLQVVPSNQSYPIRRFDDVIIAYNPDTPPLSLTVPTERILVQGQVVHEDPCRPGELLPVPNVLVYAEAIDVNSQSTRDITSENGVFSLNIPADTREIRFETRIPLSDLWANSLNSASEIAIEALPIASFPPVTIPEDPSEWSPLLFLGKWPVPQTIELRITDSQNGALSQTFVSINGSLLISSEENTNVIQPENLRYHRLFQPQEAVSTIPLLPGEYSITAATRNDENSFISAISEPIHVVLNEDCTTTSFPAITNLQIETQLPLINGNVTREIDGTIVPETRIAFKIIQENSAFSDPFLTTFAFSDNEGNFTVSLSPGKYQIIATPPHSSRLASNFRVIEIRELEDIHIILETSGEIGGRIINGIDQNPIINAEIEAFAIVGENPLLLFTTRTDNNGNYRLSLPTSMPEFDSDE